AFPGYHATAQSYRRDEKSRLGTCRDFLECVFALLEAALEADQATDGVTLAVPGADRPVLVVDLAGDREAGDDIVRNVGGDAEGFAFVIRDSQIGLSLLVELIGAAAPDGPVALP